ncbi:MAG: hypothetical protein CL489_12735 [Acidobacteria bacterium]|nr:hypothetical protein [Acidobacteriota bacterium]
MRQIPSADGRLTATVEGDIKAVDKILRITEIRVRYVLKIPIGTRAAADRALMTHEGKCPAAMSVHDCIKIAITAEVTEE